MNPLVKNSNANNPMSLLPQFMQNPIGALRQAGYNVPDGMHDPRQIANYLINNGQLNSGKLAQLQKMAQNLRFMR